MILAQVHQERELLELDGQVHRDQADLGRQTQDRRGEVQYTTDAG